MSASARRRRSSHDREMVRIALPALGALAAEPLYVLVDTAIVGHLGTPQLAALGIAATVLNTGFSLFNFLAYATTAAVARLAGAGRTAAADAMAAQALWLAGAIGLVLLVLSEALAVPLVALMGGHGRTGALAVDYLRIAALGLPFTLLALAGQGWLRGVADLRSPLIVVIAANFLNLALEVVFVYGLHWGVKGSAAGTAIAQAGMGGAFVWLLLRRAGAGRPHGGSIRPLVRVGGEIFVRTAALTGSFAVASAILARVGTASLGAHQVAFELWSFLALVLDAIAIAGQVIVGRALGGGEAGEARAAALRMIWWSVAFGGLLGAVMLALGGVLPRAFTDDPAVLAHARAVWPLFAAMQPAAGAVFALDGILIGAGDTRFLMWSMLACALGIFVPVSLLALALGWGIVGVWCGLVGLIASRLLVTALRFARGGWAVTGASR